MVLVLFNVIFSAVTAIVDLLSRLILTATAYLIVLVIQASKLFGGAVKVVAEEGFDGVRSFLEFFFVSLVEVIGDIFSTLSDLVKGGISVSGDAIGSAIQVLIKQTGNSFSLLMKALAQVFAGFVQMLSTVMTDLWKNFRDAAGYVTKNA